MHGCLRSKKPTIAPQLRCPIVARVPELLTSTRSADLFATLRNFPCQAAQVGGLLNAGSGTVASTGISDVNHRVLGTGVKQL